MLSASLQGLTAFSLSCVPSGRCLQASSNREPGRARRRRTDREGREETDRQTFLGPFTSMPKTHRGLTMTPPTPIPGEQPVSFQGAGRPAPP